MKTPAGFRPRRPLSEGMGMRACALVLAVAVLGAGPARADDCAVHRSLRFSESGFARIQNGMTRAQVDALLGLPLRENAIGSPEIWRYDAAKASVTFSEGAVIYASGANAVSRGMTAAAVEKTLGKPSKIEPPSLTTTLHFTEAGRCATFAARSVTIGPDGRVTGKSANDRAPAPKSALEIH
jgi:outer membrane protein assembly factor BamE (lipoprotein component of BamABCDE complex)